MENGFEQHNFTQAKKLLDFTNATIAIRPGCQLIQKRISSKDAKVAKDSSMQHIYGKTKQKTMRKKIRN
jgi:hypothetical protein